MFGCGANRGHFCVRSVNMTMKQKNILRPVMMAFGVLVALLAFVETKAQTTAGYMYGKVYTERTTYVGPIRWNGDEALWSDWFNAGKRGNDYSRYITRQEEDRNYDWSFTSIWEDGTSHQFTCQFGNLKEIIPYGDNASVVLKNGQEIRLSGSGYSDINTKVQVLDEELGVISVPWERIDRVEFLPTPEKLERVFGRPIYGTVEGGRGTKITGYIVWDNDERLTTDKLDGDSDEGDDISIKFSEIVKIEKQGRGSEVTLKSGRTLYLRGSNDVNSENRGVLVINPEIGVAKYSWEAFWKVEFKEPPGTGQGFNDYPTPQKMKGTVTLLSGTSHSGEIVYDLDETYDFEIVEGDDNDIEYSVPLRNIKKITPKNYDYSTLELRSGKTLLLGGKRDVSEKNSGVLVFTQKKDPVFIPWRKIGEITFE